MQKNSLWWSLTWEFCCWSDGERNKKNIAKPRWKKLCQYHWEINTHAKPWTMNIFSCINSVFRDNVFFLTGRSTGEHTDVKRNGKNVRFLLTSDWICFLKMVNESPITYNGFVCEAFRRYPWKWKNFVRVSHRQFYPLYTIFLLGCTQNEGKFWMNSNLTCNLTYCWRIITSNQYNSWLEAFISRMVRLVSFFRGQS